MSFKRIVSSLVVYPIALVFFIGVSNSQAQTSPTPAQIAQLKNMPDAQRKKLAAQAGIDISQFVNGTRQGASVDSEAKNNLTNSNLELFDIYGNQILEPRAKEKTNQLTLFGIDIFDSSSALTPLTNVNVPSSYMLGIGDTITVLYYGNESLELDLKIDHQGRVNLPTIGPVALAGRTFLEAKEIIKSKVATELIGAQVSLTMKELRTIQIYVAGETKNPGAYLVSSLSTMIQALYVSGGVTDIASVRNIQLKRSGELIRSFDLYDLLNNGDISGDGSLQDGDVVFVPTVERTVTVKGNVKRAGIYELKQEKHLGQVLDLAGGPSSNAYTKAIGVKRVKSGKTTQLTVSIDNQSLVIENGDVIELEGVGSEVKEAISMIGAVTRPGKYQWYNGISLANLLGNIETTLLNSADKRYVVIVRQKNINRDIEVIQADLTQLDVFNPQLVKNDHILVFSRIENEFLNDFTLDDFEFTSEQIKNTERSNWESLIEERLFFKQLGLSVTNDSTARRLRIKALEEGRGIQLTEKEIEQYYEFKDSSHFSRKRLLAPVLEQLKSQASFGEPLQVVTIAGEVKVPGEYPLTQETNLTSLLKAAGGLTEASFIGRAEVTRISVSQENETDFQHFSINLSDAINKANTDFTLEAKDIVNILTIPDWQDTLTIEIKGEVKFPGSYTFKRGESIIDVMNRAGGLTDYADSNAAVFTRESLREKERQNLVKLAQELRKQIASQSLSNNASGGAVVGYEQAKSLLTDITSAEAVGRLVIDLDNVLESGSEQSLALENGDFLYIPSTSQSVNVIGEVYVPTSHLFSSGLTFDEYVNKSGGYRTLADIDKTYIIRADGSVEVPYLKKGSWFKGGESVSVQPGDTIVVPLDAGYMDDLTLWSTATQILYQLAVAVAAVGTI